MTKSEEKEVIRVCGKDYENPLDIPAFLRICMVCGRITTERHKFCDDPDDEVGYWDWCHDGCYEDLQDSL